MDNKTNWMCHMLSQNRWIFSTWETKISDGCSWNQVVTCVLQAYDEYITQVRTELTGDVDLEPVHSPVKPQIKQPAESKRLVKSLSPPEVRAHLGGEPEGVKNRSSPSTTPPDMTASPITPGKHRHRFRLSVHLTWIWGMLLLESWQVKEILKINKEGSLNFGKRRSKFGAGWWGCHVCIMIKSQDHPL